ncbi:AtpZ/AtpI family protein [Teichococcus oryzae]|uniref:ATP synthase protein I n=1 Tax=Teichococcus oryzae TaxID=1608942 RepID=A0A5B2TGL3_9PROT|nr:AtpZ/AtpI family protein [Pseudoroseomonas oryzae]KAA2213243.1 AtpZ/AtpI family protein [Pseudoroseomonas oryzae]
MTERDEFDERLKQARQRRGLEKDASDPKAGQDGLPAGALQIGLRAGIEVVSALIAGAGLGWLLDHWLGSFPWLFLVFFVVGGVAGVMNVYRLFSPRRGAGK